MIRDFLVRLTSHRHGPELLIFVLGALAFLLHGLQPQAAGLEAQRRIRLPDGGQLSRQATWATDAVDAEPSQVDIEEWLRGEVLYREALRLGLDRDDVIVRRRLIQKMEYLLDGMAEIPTLDAEALEEYYLANGERYRRQSRYSFDHLFFDARHGMHNAQTRASEALARLGSPSFSGNWQALGDPFAEGTAIRSMSSSRASQLFGADFLDALGRSAQAQWSGPHRSRYGVHLVRVHSVQPATVPPLEEVHSAVARDYIEAFRKERSEAHFSRIEARYEVLGQ